MTTMLATFRDVKVGDVVERVLAGSLPMKLTVTDVTEKLIVCGNWTFDRDSGVEVDDELGWSEWPTGSRLVG